MPNRAERLTGGLVGLLVGDALGVPYEFSPASAIPPLDQIELEPPANFYRAHGGVPPGTWSDDGAQALCLLASLQECGKVDPDDLGRRFLTWYEEGYMAVDRRVFDIGIHTSRVLRALKSGMPVLQAGALGEQAKGNGSLMRVLPLVLWHAGSDAELVADAQLQSCVTHADPTCQVCCALYCLWARAILHETAQPWQTAVTTLRQLYADKPRYREELEALQPDQPPTGMGSGYVVDCLQSTRLVMEAGDYDVVVKAAIALGNDTDTTACVAGGLAGLRDGIDAIPNRWREGLRGQGLFQPLLEQLLQG